MSITDNAACLPVAAPRMRPDNVEISLLSLSKVESGRIAEFAGALSLAALVLTAFVATSYVASEDPTAVILANVRPYCAAGLMIAGVVLCVFGRRIRAMVFALAAIAIFVDLGATLLRQRNVWSAARSEAGVRLLTVLNFNVYNRNRRDAREVASALAAFPADVIVLLEATRLKPHMAMLHKSFPHLAGCQDLNDACDTVILSRYPVSEIAVRTLGPISPNRFVSARITMGADAVTVVAAHLTKPYFDHYGWLEVRRLAHFINQLPGPLLLAGDFNAAPWSGTLALLISRTGLVSGPAIIPTWPSAMGNLGLPIDYILTRPPAVVERILPFADNLGSNHRGLAAQIRY